MWLPANDQRVIKWQTPKQRGDAIGHEFLFAMEDKNAPADQRLRPIIQSDTAVRWEATFEPLKRSLPRAYPWLLFGHLEDGPEAKATAGPWIDEDEKDPEVERQIPLVFPRGMVAASANLDLLLGTRIANGVSADSLHSRIAAARVRRGVARPVLGHRALDLILPSGWESAEWDELDTLRKHPGIEDYRQVLAEIEQVALGVATSWSDFNQLVFKEHEEQTIRALERARTSFASTVVVSCGVGNRGRANQCVDW